ncbi:MAG: hypothetical protein LAT75_02405 [Candidatus Cyclonatronum sp.]|uniref:hypothetical protein n=1 Tax=Cyclonatronum sp. TaxID=3024185 RepID=UPI0025BCF26D|nr:hypothetical protein [Cyclonatronum sp.]MCH8485686.1 hypothetical protein [Cyclonatronum sp.]
MKRAIRNLLLFSGALMLFAPAVLFAQHPAFDQNFGFSMFNERNHPELKWVSAETEHFIITYPEHLAGIEAEAAAIAEATYAALSANLNVTFDYKIRIFLSDEDEIVNGFAVPFWRSYTNIWVNLNDVAEAWSGPEKWLRTVLAHELAHIFHFEAVKSNLPLFGAVATGISLPEPWTEGIAQYYTEPWHVLRGDQLLRTSIYDGRPDFRRNESIRDRGLMYASGNAQLRYFASTYGDSLVTQILAHRDTTLFGLVRTHNFDNAFRAVTGQRFRDFEDEWRRHMSIYYNTLAGQMERSDSLGVKPDTLAGLIISDVQYSPDGTKYASIALNSTSKPVVELALHSNNSRQNRRVVDRGSISGPVSWSPDSRYIAYSANVRGRNGSLINDLYRIDTQTGRRERITHSRRASNPQFGTGSSTIFFVGNDAGTGNIYRLNLESGQETKLTEHHGDVQIGRMAMHPEGTHLAYALFDADGSRQIIVLELESRREMRFTDPVTDDRNPLWSPDGRYLAYTSMRDQVPNLFVRSAFETDSVEERVTALFTGASAVQWLPADSLHVQGRFTLLTTDSKSDNRVYRADASRRAAEPRPDINPAYTRWLTHQPPHSIAREIPADPGLITDRYRYNSWRNISHVSTIPFPFFGDADNYGAGFISLWSEPLSKHMITAVGALSFPSFTDNSLLFLSYTNNQLRPSISLNAYHNSFTGRFYERDFLITTNSGGFLLASLPRDWFDSAFIRTTLYSRLRYEYTNADRNWTSPRVQRLPTPESGWQSDVRLGVRIHKSVPYAWNVVHPLEGYGLEARVTLATDALGGETNYLRPDLKAFLILPGLGDARFYFYGRAIFQNGESFGQDYIGFSRYDDIQFGDSLPGLDILYSDTERVRGYSSWVDGYVTGNRMLFGTVEYRIPLFPSLQTQVLGLVSLGRTTVAAFMDGGAVWDDDLLPADGSVRRLGTGFELKNELNFAGLQIAHSLGYAQPFRDFGTGRNEEIYYRIKAVIPF